MRARDAATALSIATLTLALGACFDLFHSTASVRTACEVDASRPGCAPDAAAAVTPDAVDICATTSTAARQEADRACAWLGACETPTGGNAFGLCSVQARLAYDCASNPAHRVAGKALDFWSCMLGVKTCPDVTACVLPGAPETCADAGPLPSCSASGDGVVSCGSGAARAENCSMNGRTCAPGGPAGAGCVGPGGFACKGSICDPVTGALQICPGEPASADLGIQCADNGGQTCEVFPSRDTPMWAACVVGGPAAAALACTPNASATCDGGVATSCPTGVIETIDCAAILGDESGCISGPLSPEFDWTSACAVSPPSCAADECDDAGDVLTGCARGAAFSVNCAEAGLGPCALTADLDAGVAVAAACTPP